MKIERYGNLVCPMPYADTQGNQIRPAIRERLDNVVEKAFNIKKNIFSFLLWQWQTGTYLYTKI